jgi:zinc/manganese transport system substrate-binding protein
VPTEHILSEEVTMKLKIIVLWVLLMIFPANPVFAKLHVVATLPWIGSMVQEIGQDKVNLDILVKGTQDPHYVEAKPSMILAVRRADILFYNGLDLEVGYLPVLLESSRNPKIQPGTSGHIDCSQFVEVINLSTHVDRSMGDVHPFGNPHYHLSPRNIKRVAKGITEMLSRADPDNTDFYKTNLLYFADTVYKKEADWSKNTLKGLKVVAYHKLFEYLADEFDFTIVGYIEPKPGIPPSIGHTKRLIDTINEQNIHIVLTTPLYPRKEADFIAEKTNAAVIVLPHDVGSMKGVNNWLDLMDTILTKLQ